MRMYGVSQTSTKVLDKDASDDVKCVAVRADGSAVITASKNNKGWVSVVASNNFL